MSISRFLCQMSHNTRVISIPSQDLYVGKRSSKSNQTVGHDCTNTQASYNTSNVLEADLHHLTIASLGHSNFSACPTVQLTRIAEVESFAHCNPATISVIQKPPFISANKALPQSEGLRLSGGKWRQ